MGFFRREKPIHEQLADEAGLTLYVETHRDRMTTDLLFTLQLVDAVPSLRLTADLSHFVVGREFRYPISAENEALVGRILERSWAFHGRVATREQVQVQLSFPHQRMWLDVFRGWWELGFRDWRRRAPSSATLVFTPELHLPGGARRLPRPPRRRVARCGRGRRQ